MSKKVVIVMLGDGDSGKSCMVTRYVNNEFLEYYDPTIQDSFNKIITIDNDPVVVEILDTAGQDEYFSLNETLIMKGDGFMFLYNILKPDGLEKLDLIIRNVFELRGVSPPKSNMGIVICGNKSDKAAERIIQKDDGIKLAIKYNADFYESKI